MDVQEYLKQGYLLDQRINYHLRRLEETKNMIDGVNSPLIRPDKVKTSPDGEAPYVKAYLKMAELNERINQEIDLLFDLRNQIDEVLRTVRSEKHRMVLLYRYIEGRTWEDIGIMLNADKSTVKRWHQEALQMVKMPENPIVIQNMQ